MAYTHCIARLQQAAGRELSDAEIKGIYERIHKAALDIKAGRAETKTGDMFDNVVSDAAQKAAADLIHEAEQKARQAHLQMVKMSARIRDADTMAASGIAPLDAVERTIVRDYSGKTNVESMEQRVAGHKAYFGSKLLSTWDALGKDWLGFFQNREKLLMLIKELRGEDTGDALAKKGAKAFHDVAEEARRTFNAAGGDIGRLDDWGMPQHHSQIKVATAGRDAWTDAILPLLDRTRYADDIGNAWDDARMREFLGKAWDTIATDGHANAEPGTFTGSGKRGNRHAESRQIHFKDAESVIGYWNTFGEKTAVEILHGHIDTMARDIGFIEHFGPNPDITYRTLRDRALRAATVADPVKTESLEGRAVKLDILYDYAAGKIKPSANQKLSAVADGIAHLNAAGKLGGAALASLFGDKPMMEAVSHLNNLPMLQRWRTELALLNPANAADRRLMQQQGLMIENVRSGLARFYEGLGSTGTTGKLANAVMRITGMNAINDIRKGAFGTSLMSAIGDQIAAGKGFADLDKTDIRALKHYGISADDWAIWQQAKLQDIGHGNANALTPEAISRVGDTEIAAQIPARLQTLRDQMQAHIDKLDLRNQQEGGWLQKRFDKFAAAQVAANKRIGELAVSKDEKAKAIAESIGLRIELLQAEIDRVRVRNDIEAAFANETNADKVRGLMADVHRATNQANDYTPGANSELTRLFEGTGQNQGRGDTTAAAVGRRNETIGYGYGKREGALSRRIVELESKIKSAERSGYADVKAADKVEIKRLDAMREEVMAFWVRSENRQARRQHVMDRIANDIDPKVSQEIERARRDAIVKLLGAVNTESDFAIVTPGWKERAAFYGDLQRGTVKGEIVRSVLQFKSFPWAMFHRMADAVANKDAPVSKAAMTAYLVASTTLAGAMLMQTRDMLAGKDPRQMDKPEFWGSAFLQGGALGIYGDFLYGAGHTRYGSGILESAAGPTIGPLLELGLVQPIQAIAKARDGKETHFLAQEAQDLKGFIPGGNIWYTKAAFDHLVSQQVFEALSPGYLSSIRSRTMKEYNQDWWWQPGELTPDRAPNLEAATGR